MVNKKILRPICILFFIFTPLIILSACEFTSKLLKTVHTMGRGIVAIQTIEVTDGVYVGRINMDDDEIYLLGGGAIVIPRSHDGEPHRTVFNPHRFGISLLVYSDYPPSNARDRTQQPVVHILDTSSTEILSVKARFPNIEEQIVELLYEHDWYYVHSAYWVDEDHIAVRIGGSWSQFPQSNHLLMTYDLTGALTDHGWISRDTRPHASTHQNEAGRRIQIQNGQLDVDGNVQTLSNPPIHQSFTPRAANGLMYYDP